MVPALLIALAPLPNQVKFELLMIYFSADIPDTAAIVV